MRERADVALEATARGDFLEWRDRLLPGREPRTVNRDVRALIAGLIHAMELGHVGNSAAWRLKPLSDDVEDAAAFPDRRTAERAS